MSSVGMTPEVVNDCLIASRRSSEVTAAAVRRRSRTAAIACSVARRERRIPGELCLVLHAPSIGKELVVALDQYSARPKVFRDPERKRGRRDCLGDAERPARAERHLAVVLVKRRRLLENVVRAEVVGRVEDETQPLDASQLHRGDEEMALAAMLDVDARVGNEDGKLVAQLRRAGGVGNYENCWHDPGL